ncbi:hypothetical protein Afil01_07230 [Actinorhabdospora filicis]|uniref:ATP synthase protein I n=1 Tax=Actinorhabdospora filicis TaxID=1785913 RepID=A0A9W6SI39_9ACTN|nr:hypothetical protein [Actinorhabdospora filicis]GLZ75916.1 hypothetical protein Afil01_07230 [Actinorhabdospora filicis]
MTGEGDEQPKPARAPKLSRRVKMVRPSLITSAGLLVPLCVAGAIWKGAPGAWGAFVGLAVVTVMFTASWYGIAWVETWDMRLVLPAGMMAYTFKIIVVMAALLFASRLEWAGLMPMVASIAVSITAWLTVLMIWGVRARLPYVDDEKHVE